MQENSFSRLGFHGVLMILLLASNNVGAQADAEPAKATDEVACTMQYEPVCGVNGKTYSNDCMARVAGVEVADAGVCAVGTTPSNVICPEEPDPVCGADDVTYENECRAKAAGVEILFLWTLPGSGRLPGKFCSRLRC